MAPNIDIESIFKGAVHKLVPSDQMPKSRVMYSTSSSNGTKSSTILYSKCHVSFETLVSCMYHWQAQCA